MPLVAHTELPTFAALREQGHELLSLDRARRQDIRELHIGFLNMMPDTALKATERQFIRLIGSCNRIAQFYVYPFSLDALARSNDANDYIATHYSRFETLQAAGLDALIITGANVSNPALEQEAFWEPLMEVVDWANENVASVLCSCLATHALLKARYGIARQPLARKRWGVYSHRISTPGHPLLRDVNTRFDAPHSRHNDISQAQLEAAGLTVLAASEQGGVHLAVSPDGCREVFFQGHPEYDQVSLLKEYKRELLRYRSGERAEAPPVPEQYLSADAQQELESLVDALAPGASVGDQLERRLGPHLDNTWGDTAKALFNNWLGMVYQLTSLDRQKQFMAHVDPADPLGWRRAHDAERSRRAR
ncbi:MAG: homoserine O-succinyltransferase [Gammaproteobacteria bacterium]